MITQIYEIQTPKEAAQCIELGVDHIGSVLLSQEEWKQPLIKDWNFSKKMKLIGRIIRTKIFIVRYLN